MKKTGTTRIGPSPQGSGRPPRARRRRKPATGTILWPAIPEGATAAVRSLVFQMGQTQWWPPERLLARQLSLIETLIGHAVNTVPYYRDSFRRGADIGPGPLSMDSFRRLPILQRTHIQDAGDGLITRALPQGHGPMFDVRTTGSTGRPVRVKGTRLTGMMFEALSLRYHQWHKRDLSAKDVTMRGVKGKRPIIRHRTWVAGIPGKGSVTCDVTMPISWLFDVLIKENPEYLQTRPQTLLGLIQHSADVGIKPKKLREVRTFGEVMDDAVRAACREEWNVPVTDLYSCMEINAIALQCPDHDRDHYHVQSENVLLEILDDDGAPCPPGQLGRVVMTALNNFATPLIRYELGDLAELGEPCSCGRGLPVLKRIAGRVKNLLTLPSGEKVFPDFTAESVLTSLPIRQFQLTQKSLELIEVTLAVKRPLSTDEEKEFGDHINSRFRCAFEYRFIYVDEIPRAAGGKFETFRSEVIPQ